jgi:hypothetical protein
VARVASVGMVKGVSQYKQTHPAEGTKSRLVYDVLLEHRGRRVPKDDLRALRELAGTRTRSGYWNISTQIQDLVLYYGCDIRNNVLVGEWFGRVYVDYTQPAEDEARRVMSNSELPRDLGLMVRDALLGCRPGGSSESLELVG